MIAKLLFVVSIAFSLTGCAATLYAPEPATRDAQRRELTATEKEAISAPLRARAKDPASVLFRFPPVVLRSVDGGFEYCGYWSGKNIFGRQIAFRRYFARLKKGGDGQLSQIEIVELSTDYYSLMRVANSCSLAGYGRS